MTKFDVFTGRGANADHWGEISSSGGGGAIAPPVNMLDEALQHARIPRGQHAHERFNTNMKYSDTTQPSCVPQQCHLVVNKSTNNSGKLARWQHRPDTLARYLPAPLRYTGQVAAPPTHPSMHNRKYLPLHTAVQMLVVHCNADCTRFPLGDRYHGSTPIGGFCHRLNYSGCFHSF